MKTPPLSRRSVLRGMGIAVGLPLLEAMLPIGKTAFAADMSSPKRFLAYYCPNGFVMPSWVPSQTGKNYQLSPSLQPLENVKDHFSVISNLDNLPQRPDGRGHHAAGTGSFLTTVFIPKIRSLKAAKSLDQVIADAVGHNTRLASLELGMEGGNHSGSCDSGYSCAYSRTISWRSANQPNPKIINPKAAFDRVFADGVSNAFTDNHKGRHILDYVRDDAKRLSRKLGHNDRVKVEEYLTGLETLEKQYQQADTDAGGSCRTNSVEDPNGNMGVTEKARWMADLMVAAFECDATRVQTFMLGNAVSNRNYQFIGAPGGHHNLSHHRNNRSNLDKLRKIDYWEMQQFAYLLEGLNNARDVSGNTLLSSCNVFLSNEISDGDRHSNTNKPIILAGGGNGFFKTGEHIRMNREPVASLFLSILQSHGINQSSFGNSRGALNRVHA